MGVGGCVCRECEMRQCSFLALIRFFCPLAVLDLFIAMLQSRVQSISRYCSLFLLFGVLHSEEHCGRIGGHF